MRIVKQRSSFTVRVHCYDAQGVPAVPLTAHWRLTTSQGKVIADWVELTVQTVTSGGQLVDVYVDVPLVSGLTATPGDYTLLVVLDKDTDTELTEEVPFRVAQVRGR